MIDNIIIFIIGLICCLLFIENGKKSQNNNKKFNNTFSECLRSFWINYTETGRATRSEYWWNVFIYMVSIGTLISFSQYLELFWILVTIIPTIYLTIRRLHDIGLSAWNILWFPIGILVFMIFIIAIITTVCFLNHTLLSSYMENVYTFFIFCFLFSIIVSSVLMCLPGNKNTNKYGKPRI